MRSAKYTRHSIVPPIINFDKSSIYSAYDGTALSSNILPWLEEYKSKALIFRQMRQPLACILPFEVIISQIKMNSSLIHFYALIQGHRCDLSHKGLKHIVRSPKTCKARISSLIITQIKMNSSLIHFCDLIQGHRCVKRTES